VNRTTLECLSRLYGSEFMPKYVWPETLRGPAVHVRRGTAALVRLDWRSLAPVVPPPNHDAGSQSKPL
jgi:hypothetical protein